MAIEAANKKRYKLNRGEPGCRLMTEIEDGRPVTAGSTPRVGPPESPAPLAPLRFSDFNEDPRDGL